MLFLKLVPSDLINLFLFYPLRLLSVNPLLWVIFQHMSCRFTVWNEASLVCQWSPIWNLFELFSQHGGCMCFYSSIKFGFLPVHRCTEQRSSATFHARFFESFRVTQWLGFNYLHSTPLCGWTDPYAWATSLKCLFTCNVIAHTAVPSS